MLEKNNAFENMNENFNLYIYLIIFLDKYIFKPWAHWIQFHVHIHICIYVCVYIYIYILFFRSMRMRTSWKHDRSLKIQNRAPQIKKPEKKNEIENIPKRQTA